MWTRREALATGAVLGLGAGCRRKGAKDPLWVNDVHSQLNRTRVAELARPGSVGELQRAVARARDAGRGVSIAGGRHAMGGQQFGAGTLLVDTRGLGQVLELDPETGQVEAEAGIMWPALIEELGHRQSGGATAWGIAQKQTGADRLSLGGSLSANVHGRGLRMKPMIADVEALTLLRADGELVRCSRSENAALFRLAVGGYGLFGVIASVRLRLVPRQRIERVVELADVSDLPRLFDERLAAGFLYGDFQFATDLSTELGLRRGVLSCYRPAPEGASVSRPRRLPRRAWLELVRLAHLDRAKAFARYSKFYLSTNGQVYWSDTHQLSPYLDDYHHALGGRLGSAAGGSEMITEIYVPRGRLPGFMEAARRDLEEGGAELIYGTVRLIERDDESFLAWAKGPWACVIFNLHLQHDEASLERGRATFRQLIDRGIEHGGSYYLTYHHWARRDQVLACYPQLPTFLNLKLEHDPDDVFQSEWYRHVRELLGGEGAEA